MSLTKIANRPKTSFMYLKNQKCSNESVFSPETCDINVFVLLLHMPENKLHLNLISALQQ